MERTLFIVRIHWGWNWIVVINLPRVRAHSHYNALKNVPIISCACVHFYAHLFFCIVFFFFFFSKACFLWPYCCGGEVFCSTVSLYAFTRVYVHCSAILCKLCKKWCCQKSHIYWKRRETLSSGVNITPRIFFPWGEIQVPAHSMNGPHEYCMFYILHFTDWTSLLLPDCDPLMS